MIVLHFYLRKLYRHSFKLSETKDSEYLSIVGELMRTDGVQYMSKTIQHSDITTFEHVRSVSFISYKICKHLKWNYVAAARGALLHDLVYYDWHDSDKSHRLHGYRHPGFALKNAGELTNLSELEENIILRHMFPLTPIPPRYKESILVSLVDKYCATKETLRKYQRNPEVLRNV